MKRMNSGQTGWPDDSTGAANEAAGLIVASIYLLTALGIGMLAGGLLVWLVT